MNIKLNEFKINAPQAKVYTDFKYITRNFAFQSVSYAIECANAINHSIVKNPKFENLEVWLWL